MSSVTDGTGSVTADEINVLHVDDDPAFGQLTAEFLTRGDARIRVARATSAADGLDHLETAPVDCIVSDFDMPGSSGIEFLRTVRETSTVPFILFTGKGSEEVASEAIAAGVTDYLQKRTGTDHYSLLTRRIVEAVEKRRTEQRLDHVRSRAQALMNTTTIAETARVATTAAEEAIGATLSGVHLFDEDADALVPCAVTTGVSERYADPPSFPRGEPAGTRAAITWEVFERGESVIIPDTEAYDRLDEPSLTRCVIIHPLSEHGVFIASTTEPDAYDEADCHLIEILAGYLTSALDRVRREADLREREDRLARLNRATRELVGLESQREVAAHAVTAAEEILGFSITVLRLYDPEVDGLVPVAESDAVADVLPERTVFTRAGGSLNWRAFEAGTVREYDDIGNADGALDADTDLASLLVVPLGEYGTLAIGETEAAAFDDTDVLLARILATATETALVATDRETELRDQRNELAARNRRLAEFATIVSHDLKSPLSVASGRLELAREVADDEGDAHLAAVATAHGRMRELVGDLLSLAEDDATPEREAVELRSLVESCRVTVETAGATLETETDAVVEAEAARVRQLLENLFTNSVTHGGTDVAVAVGDLDGGFYVEDDGVGIPPEDREAVLDRGHTTTETGSGYGLYIVTDVATDHGWTVDVTESADGGVRFEFTGVDLVPASHD